MEETFTGIIDYTNILEDPITAYTDYDVDEIKRIDALRDKKGGASGTSGTSCWGNSCG